MYTFDEIVGIIRQRQDVQSPLLERMLEVKERYNGDYVIPLPSMENEPVLPPLTPALIAENIDAVAQRASSVMPFIGCPAIDQSKERGVRSREYADIRRRALAATWYSSKYKWKEHFDDKCQEEPRLECEYKCTKTFKDNYQGRLAKKKHQEDCNGKFIGREKGVRKKKKILS